MGAEREDTDPTASRAATEPGLGKGATSGATPAAAATAAPTQTIEDDAPPPVDFDALHAALGDPLDYHDMPSGPALEKAHEVDPGVDHDGRAQGAAHPGGAERIGESSGRSSATYASARPHTIPPTRATTEDPNAPAVIVASETDTVPSAPPQMTVPLAASPHAQQYAAGGLLPGAAPGGPVGHVGPPGSNPQFGAAVPGPHGAALAHPGSGPHHASSQLGSGYPATPQPIRVQPRGGPQMTIRMPDRPVNPRRGKTATVVVRPRGPSAKQKLLAFMAMLLLVTACGIAVIIWRKPRLLGLDSLGTTPSAGPSMTAPATTPTTSTLGAGTSTNGSGPIITPVGTSSGANGAAPAAGSASGSPSSSASAKKGPKAQPGASTAPHPPSSAPSSRL
jgi:hypothetical protein